MNEKELVEDSNKLDEHLPVAGWIPVPSLCVAVSTIVQLGFGQGCGG